MIRIVKSHSTELPSSESRWTTGRSALLAAAGLSVCLLLPSCGDDKSFNDRGVADKTTAPVTGRILVDGEPVEHLKVICQKVDAADTPSVRSLGDTDAAGNLTFSTFEGADGVPPGEWVLTFGWHEWDDYWKRHEGPDKLGGRFSDPATSEYRLTVREGETTDLGTIELSTE